MLSKSQARIFFLGGTIIFGGAFIALTIDSMKQVPKQTKEEDLTEQVVRGKEIWEKNNCMGCHTLFGEGAYYAPELTKVVKRRGETWIKTFLKDPQAMFPGERKMVQYNFTDEQIDDIYSFFEWCGNVDLNGFPADPPLKPAEPARPASHTVEGASPQSAVAQPEIFTQLCMACHSIGGSGANVGPALDNISTKYNHEQLKAWISDPASVKPGTKMPKLPLSDEQLEGLVNYLLQTPAQAEEKGDQ